MSTDFNPYSAPETPGAPPKTPMTRKANLGQRFLGALVDGMVGVVILPGYIVMIVSAEQGDGEFGPVAMMGLAWVIVTAIALMVAQLYLLATRSQSIGKYVVKTQIVDINTGQRSDFVHCVLLRGLVNGMIGGIPCIGPIYTIVDICFIFREDHRCIHDLIASTMVVDIS